LDLLVGRVDERCLRGVEDGQEGVVDPGDGSEVRLGEEKRGERRILCPDLEEPFVDGIDDLRCRQELTTQLDNRLLVRQHPELFRGFFLPYRDGEVREITRPGGCEETRSIIVRGIPNVLMTRIVGSDVLVSSELKEQCFDRQLFCYDSLPDLRKIRGESLVLQGGDEADQ
jgi:hypothetical protein